MRLQNLGTDGGAIAQTTDADSAVCSRGGHLQEVIIQKQLEKVALLGVCDCLEAVVGVKFLIDVM